MSTTDATDTTDRPSSGAALPAQIREAAGRRPKTRNLRPLSRLAPYVARQKLDALLALVFLLLSTASTLGLTAASRLLVDHGFSASDAAAIDRWFLLLGAVAMLMAAASALRYYFVTKIGERSVASLRTDLYSHILSLDPGYFLKMRTGEVLSRLTADIQIVETLLSTSVSVALRNLLSLIGSMTLLVIVSPALAGMVLVMSPLILAPMFLFGRLVRKLTAKTQDKFAEAVGFAGESLDALETVQAFCQEMSSSRRFGASVEAAFKASLTRMRARAAMTAVVISLVFGGIALVLRLGAHSVVAGDMSAGALVQFVFLSVLAAGAVGALGETWGDVQKAAGAMERIDELMRAVPEIKAPAEPLALPMPARGEIRFEDVTFAYPGRADLPALRSFPLNVRPGETVALVGPSGAGKSTVFRLLLRFYDPQSGAISFDGVPLTQTDPGALRALMALVAQDAALFSGSTLENVQFGREDAGRDAVVEALADAQALSFVEALPEGMDSGVGERARLLSGGQRQRLAIARALVRDAPVLLLDEATSALDAENERLVQKALDQAIKGRTTLVIAHRLATVLRADRIIVMDGGRVVEEGTHSDLVRQGGLYARLAELQFETAQSAASRSFSSSNG